MISLEIVEDQDIHIITKYQHRKYTFGYQAEKAPL